MKTPNDTESPTAPTTSCDELDCLLRCQRLQSNKSLAVAADRPAKSHLLSRFLPPQLHFLGRHQARRIKMPNQRLREEFRSSRGLEWSGLGDRLVLPGEPGPIPVDSTNSPRFVPQKHLVKSSDQKTIMLRSDGCFHILADDQETVVEIKDADAAGFALWILSHVNK